MGINKLDFMIIGAARSGSMSLRAYLQNYNQIFMPNIKGELNFFFKDSEYRKGVKHYLDEYFNILDSNKIIGEKSTSYLYGGRKVAKRIHNFNPDIKLIVLLRNPIERTYSNYKFTVKNNIEILDFQYAINNEEDRNNHYIGKWKDIRPFDYTGRSLYYKQIKEYLEIFDKKQMHFIIYEEFISQPYIHLEKLCIFLNLDFIKDIELKKINSTDMTQQMNKYSRQLVYEKVVKDIDKLSVLLGKDLFNIWNLDEKKI